jgi:hypothetical protein
MIDPAAARVVGLGLRLRLGLGLGRVSRHAPGMPGLTGSGGVAAARS